MKKKRQLTARQKRFCDEYLLCMNASEAARKAGYSEKTAGTIGQQNLQKLDIREYIDQRKQAEEELLGFNRFTQISDLLEIKKRCQDKEDFDARAAISAITEMNKMMGYHAPEKHDLTSKGEQLQPIVGMVVK